MKKLILTSALILLSVEAAYACKPIPNWTIAMSYKVNKIAPKVITSESGQYILKIMPTRYVVKDGVPVKTRTSFGTAYKLLESGGFQHLWTIHNLFTPNFWNTGDVNYHLGNDGNTLVAWKNKVSRKTDKTALQVFNRGKLARHYAINDFISSSARLPTLCGYMGWSSDFEVEAGKLKFRTINNKAWSFPIYGKPTAQ